MKKIIWLASYPKSGNTWFRAFLTNLLDDADQPADINDLLGHIMASSKDLISRYTDLQSSDLTPEEMSNLRPELYRRLAEETVEPVYMKIHDAHGQDLIDPGITKGVIYFIRNPLEVTLSFAHHKNQSIDRIIDFMADDQAGMCMDNTRYEFQFAQQLLSWSDHVVSWVDNPDFPVHVIRYEDMVGDAFPTFSRAVDFLGLSYTEQQIRKAIEFSSFQILRAQEQEKGFRERSPVARNFFRRGRTDSWKEILSPAQRQRIIEHHRAVMERFGY